MTPQERAEFIADIASAIRIRSTDHILTDDEVVAIRLLIKKQEQSIAFRQAIIDKTLGALIKSAATALLAGAALWFMTHIYKS
jgi:hypothetical protein